MEHFITLTLKNSGKPITMNADAIVAIYPDYTQETNATLVLLRGLEEEPVYVQENMKEVRALLQNAENASDDRLHLVCLRCGKEQAFSIHSMQEMGYTRYSYCEDCIRKGIHTLKKKKKVGGTQCTIRLAEKRH